VIRFSRTGTSLHVHMARSEVGIGSVALVDNVDRNIDTISLILRDDISMYLCLFYLGTYLPLKFLD
jgi:hypothetical protein